MTLNEFLDNPIGKGDASVNVSLIRQMLDGKYQVYEDSKKNKEIKMKVFHQPLKDVYWIWLTIPTETERDNSYDVVYTFTNPKSTDRLTQAIGKFDIQIFSNTPSFAFTYAYVYNKNGMLIPSLANKLGRTFLKDSPDVRNRNQLMLFDKYVYFGARYIKDSKILNRMVADARASKYDEKYLNGQIRSLNTIMDEYKDATERLRIKKQKSTSKEKTKRLLGKETSGVNRISGNNSKNGVNKVVKNAARRTTVSKRKGTITKK